MIGANASNCMDKSEQNALLKGATLALLVAISIWWRYFDSHIAHERIFLKHHVRVFWQISHYVLFSAISLRGATLGLALADWGTNKPLPDYVSNLLIVTSIFIELSAGLIRAFNLPPRRRRLGRAHFSTAALFACGQAALNTFFFLVPGGGWKAESMLRTLAGMNLIFIFCDIAYWHYFYYIKHD